MSWQVNKNETKEICLRPYTTFEYTIPLPSLSKGKFRFTRTRSDECKKKSSILIIHNRELENEHDLEKYVDGDDVLKIKISKYRRFIISFESTPVNEVVNGKRKKYYTRALTANIEEWDMKKKINIYTGFYDIISNEKYDFREPDYHTLVSRNCAKFKARCVDICILMQPELLNDENEHCFSVKQPFKDF